MEDLLFLLSFFVFFQNILKNVQAWVRKLRFTQKFKLFHHLCSKPVWLCSLENKRWVFREYCSHSLQYTGSEWWLRLSSLLQPFDSFVWGTGTEITSSRFSVKSNLNFSTFLMLIYHTALEDLAYCFICLWFYGVSDAFWTLTVPGHHMLLLNVKLHHHSPKFVLLCLTEERDILLLKRNSSPKNDSRHDFGQSIYI